MTIYYHVCKNYDGDDLLSLYEQYGHEAYEMFAERWPDGGNMGEYHAHHVHLYATFEEAQRHAAEEGGDILFVESDEFIEIETDDLEFPHPVVRDRIRRECVKRVK
jgi:hypothetical protein